ncbi:unnamed protein product, partial [Polarella glacialis]
MFLEMSRPSGAACSLLLLWSSWMAQVVGSEGDPSCWMGALQFDTCCLPPPRGKASCWEGSFSYQRCCLSGAILPVVDVNSVEDISQLGGCELNIFQEFKTRSGAWYKENRANLVLFHEFVYLFSRFDAMFKSCAPAALTALLLKLESMYFADESTWNGLFQIYVEKYHQAVAEGVLLQSHHENGWPLLEGIRKVNALRSSGGEPAELGTREVVDLVVCYCGRGERVDWLRAFQKMPWRPEDRSLSTRRHVALKFYHKCGELFSEEEREAERQRLVADWGSMFRTVEVRYVDDALRADDCSAYLAYIVDRYDDLPEFTVFLHADAPEHIPTLDLLTDTVFAASRGYLPNELGFLHLSHNYVHQEVNCSASNSSCQPREKWEIQNLWKNVFGSSLVPSVTDGSLSAYCCVQFLARRERILQRDRLFYQRALSYFGETPDSYYALFPVGRVVRMVDTLGRTPCQLAMYIWHILFGEEMHLPRRHRDPRMPLFIRMLNIEVEAVLEAQAGADGHDGGSFQLNGEARSDTTYDRLQTLFQE